MINPIDFFKTELSQPVSIGDTTFMLPNAAVTELCAAMVPGTSIPLVLSYSGNPIEIVNFVSKVGNVLNIERAQFGTAEGNWPAGTCVSFVWTSEILTEYICQVAATC